MALFPRGFVLLWHGQLASQLGNQAFLIAAAYLTLEATGSPLWVAAVMAAATAPVVVLGPLGGTIADRHSRRTILILTDLARAMATGGLGVFLLWWPDVSLLHVRLAVAVAGFGGAMGAVFAPAVQAFIPDLVPRERLAAANSVNQISLQTSVLLGQASGGLLYVAWGASGLVIFTTFAFAYAAAATWFISTERRPRLPRVPLRTTLGHYADQTREGLGWVWARHRFRAVLAVFAGVNMLFMPVVVLLPFYASDATGGGPEWYGFLLAGAGAGALTGSAASAAFLHRVRARARLVRLAVAGIGCSLLLLTADALWLALAALATVGLLASLINVSVITSFQTRVPPGMRGRVMALVVALSTAATPIGMTIGGVLGDLWRDSLGLVFAGCGSAIVLVAVAATRSSAFGELLDAVGDEHDDHGDHEGQGGDTEN